VNGPRAVVEEARSGISVMVESMLSGGGRGVPCGYEAAAKGRVGQGEVAVIHGQCGCNIRTQGSREGLLEDVSLPGQVAEGG
jgi:hypothetical protein